MRRGSSCDALVAGSVRGAPPRQFSLAKNRRRERRLHPLRRGRRSYKCSYSDSSAFMRRLLVVLRLFFWQLHRIKRRGRIYLGPTSGAGGGMSLDKLGTIRRAVFWRFMVKSSRPEAMSKPAAHAVEGPSTSSGPFDALFFWRFMMKSSRPEAMSKPAARRMAPEVGFEPTIRLRRINNRGDP